MNEESLFNQAIQLPQSERASYLKRECPNAQVRARVEALLVADASINSPLDVKPGGSATVAEPVRATESLTGDSTIDMHAPMRCIADKYVLLKQIGEGGMGTVWVANQKAPVRRKVAVKLVRKDLSSSRSLLTRFEAERQAIAMMDHPNIARLLDAGATDEGEPFFVMELVNGCPLNEYCDSHQLSVLERLKLFLQVCEAVQHAHQKGIIHRDLKPSNILVETHEGKPVAKVIDFGLAKAAVGMALTDHTLYTGWGTLLGTPLYMAPEQANANSLDIDTRADVYALGVVLYELLTGSTPIARESLKQAALDEILRLIRELEPPVPSSRLSHVGTAPSIAANRHTEPLKLSRYVKGDLDWITLKALNKDRDRRYDTAIGFARDIERFLNHEPVSAGPPTTAYRLRKFVQRNRLQVAAASLIVLALMIGVVGTTLGLFEARRQQRAAESAQRSEAAQRKTAERERDEKETARQTAVAEKERADREKAVAEAVKNFVTHDLFGRAGDLGLGPAADIQAKTLLEEAAKRVGDRFQSQPEVEIEVRKALAAGFNQVGLTKACRSQHKLLLELCERHRPQDHPDILQEMLYLGTIDDGNGGNGLYPETIQYARDALAAYERVLGPEDERTIEAAERVAFSLREVVPQESMDICDKYLPKCKQLFGETGRRTLFLRDRRANALMLLRRRDEALKEFFENRELWHSGFGDDAVEMSQGATWHFISTCYMRMGKYDAAIPLIREDIKLITKIYGADHAEVTYRLSNLALCYWFKGDNLAAGPAMLDVSEGDRRTYGPRAPWGLEAQRRAVVALSRVNRLDLAKDRAESWAKADRPDDLANACSLLCMVIEHTPDAQQTQELHSRALTLLKRAIERGWEDAERLKEFTPLIDDPDFAEVVKTVGREKPNAFPNLLFAKAGTQHDQKHFDKAIELYQEAIRLQQIEIAKFPQLESLRESLGNYYDWMGGSYWRSGQHDKAIEAYKSAYETRLHLYEQSTSAQKPEYGTQAAWSLHNQGKVYLEQNRFEEAAPYYQAAADLREKLFHGQPTINNYRIAATRDLDWLGRTYHRGGRLQDAEVAYRKALDMRVEMLNANFDDQDRRVDVDWSQQRLGEVLSELHWHDKAKEVYSANVELNRKTNPQALPDALQRLGNTLILLQEWTAVETNLLEWLEQREKLLLPDDWQTCEARSQLCNVWIKQEKYEQAEPLLLKTYQEMLTCDKNVPPDSQVRIGKHLDLIIKYYAAVNQPEEAQRYRAVRAKYSPNEASPKFEDGK